jgi:hypothetical protein
MELIPGAVTTGIDRFVNAHVERGSFGDDQVHAGRRSFAAERGRSGNDPLFTGGGRSLGLLERRRSRRHCGCRGILVRTSGEQYHW